MDTNKQIGLLCFIPVEIISWFIGKKIVNGIIKGDQGEIQRLANNYPLLSLPLTLFIIVGIKYYYNS